MKTDGDVDKHLRSLKSTLKFIEKSENVSSGEKNALLSRIEAIEMKLSDQEAFEKAFCEWYDGGAYCEDGDAPDMNSLYEFLTYFKEQVYPNLQEKC